MKIQGYSNYEIYPNEGKIWSYKINKFIGAKNKKCGYWQCSLTADDGSIWKTNIHRIIWVAVNGEIPKGMQVNHIDEDKSNNCIDNLNLMTPKENTNWGTHNERMAKSLKGKPSNNPSKAVGAFKNGELIMIFSSTKEAGKNGFKQNNVCNCCNGKLKHHRGYEWKYLLN